MYEKDGGLSVRFRNVRIVLRFLMSTVRIRFLQRQDVTKYDGGDETRVPAIIGDLIYCHVNLM